VTDEKAARRANTRKVTLALLLMTSVVPFTFYAYDIERNVATRPPLRRACETIRRDLPGRMAPDLLETLFGPADGPFVARTITGWLERDCRDTDARLDFWVWNLGVKIPMHHDAAEDARMRRAFTHAEESCPAIVSQMLHELPWHTGTSQASEGVRQICEPMTHTFRVLGERPNEPVSAWDHAALLSALASELERLDSHTHGG
jgi:hypothetical protein